MRRGSQPRVPRAADSGGECDCCFVSSVHRAPLVGGGRGAGCISGGEGDPPLPIPTPPRDAHPASPPGPASTRDAWGVLTMRGAVPSLRPPRTGGGLVCPLAGPGGEAGGPGIGGVGRWRGAGAARGRGPRGGGGGAAAPVGYRSPSAWLGAGLSALGMTAWGAGGRRALRGVPFEGGGRPSPLDSSPSPLGSTTGPVRRVGPLDAHRAHIGSPLSPSQILPPPLRQKESRGAGRSNLRRACVRPPGAGVRHSRATEQIGGVRDVWCLSAGERGGRRDGGCISGGEGDPPPDAHAAPLERRGRRGAAAPVGCRFPSAALGVMREAL